MATKISLILTSNRVRAGSPFTASVFLVGAPKGNDIDISIYRLEGNESEDQRLLGSAQILIGSGGNAAHTFDNLSVPRAGLWTLVAKASEHRAAADQIIAADLNTLEAH